MSDQNGFIIPDGMIVKGADLFLIVFHDPNHSEDDHSLENDDGKPSPRGWYFQNWSKQPLRPISNYAGPYATRRDAIDFAEVATTTY